MDKLSNYDESLCFIAAQIFVDAHFGGAITEGEFEYRKKLKNEYKEEMEQAKVIADNDATFDSLSYEDKVIYCVELLKKLRIKNNKPIDVDFDDEEDKSVSYFNINDFINSIPQESCEPIEKLSKKI